MDYLPIFADVRRRRVLVVGEGEPAQLKARLLRQAGADVRIVTGAAFRAEDVGGCAAVFGATGDAGVDRTISQAAQGAGVPVNIVDRPELSSFIVPAIVDRGPVVVGISTSGTAPVLARLLRARIETLLPAGLGDLARFAGRFRRAVRGLVPDAVARRRFWERFFESALADRVVAGDARAAADMVTLVNRAQDRPVGAVYLVGTGPGDPDLLTVRATRLMQQADIAFHGSQVGPAILGRVRRDARRELIASDVPASELRDRVVREVAAARRVLLLQPGDGATGEGLAPEFRRLGLEVIVVPGVGGSAGGLVPQRAAV